MFQAQFLKACSFVLLGLGGVISASAQITVNGIADRGNYPETATFTIVSQPGFSYSAFLNGNPVQAGVAVTVNRPDYYELHVTRTDNDSGLTAFSLIRFLVIASERADTEWGLPRQF